MARNPKSEEDQFEPDEARRRFEQAVDKALRTPPAHRESKAKKPNQKPKD